MDSRRHARSSINSERLFAWSGRKYFLPGPGMLCDQFAAQQAGQADNARSEHDQGARLRSNAHEILRRSQIASLRTRYGGVDDYAGKLRVGKACGIGGHSGVVNACAPEVSGGAPSNRYQIAPLMSGSGVPTRSCRNSHAASWSDWELEEERCLHWLAKSRRH